MLLFILSSSTTTQEAGVGSYRLLPLTEATVIASGHLAGLNLLSTTYYLPKTKTNLRFPSLLAIDDQARVVLAP
jgi:hypothetical protein